MNVEIGTEAVQFPEKEYINGIFVAVWGNDTFSANLLEDYMLNSKTFSMFPFAIFE
jgi:hypothetical protein